MGDKDRYEHGLAIMKQIHGTGSPTRIEDPIAEISPDFARYVVETGFADVYGRPGLCHAQRQLINVAVLTALGDTEKLLSAHIRGALNVGVTPAEVVEAIFHVAIYAGHPRTVRGLGIVKQVLSDLQVPMPIGASDAD